MELKNSVKKTICIFLSLIIIIISGIPITALALPNSNQGDISAYMSNMDYHNANISISSVTATCYASVSTKTKMNLKITMELQKKKSSGYETVQSWTTSGTGTSLSISKSRTINALSSYRLMTSFTAGNEKQITYSYPA